MKVWEIIKIIIYETDTNEPALHSFFILVTFFLEQIQKAYINSFGLKPFILTNTALLFPKL